MYREHIIQQQSDDSHNHVISNVDGLQTALDAKLASSSYTASDVLTKIKTVDGAGSGLDADLLDGISSGSFLRSDANDTYTGTLTFQAPTNGTGVFMTKATDSADEPAILVLAGDADSEDDLAFEIRGNATGSSVDLSTTMSSADTKFAIFQSGHTTIGYNSLGTGYTPVNAYGLNVNGTISAVSGYYAGSTQVINSSGNWVGGGNISEFTNNSGYITGNQTITLSGDVSGSGTTSIAVTIADDSHNHIISNVDGLQTALDAKLASSSYTAADVLTKIKTVDGAGSGLDADLLDGQSSAYYARKTYWPDVTTQLGLTAHPLTNLNTTALWAKPAGYQTIVRGSNSN